MPLWIPLGLASAVFAALVAVLGKVGLDKTDPTLATTARAAVMFAVLLAVAAATGKLSGLSTLQGRPLLFIFLAGLAGALSWLCYFWALRIGGAGQVAALDRLSIVFVVALAAVFLGEKLTWTTALGALLMAAGAVFLTWR